MQQQIDLKSPIFSLYILGDKLIVACGGGDKKFGVKNKIILYQLQQGYIGQNLIEENLDEIPEFIEGIQSKNIFAFCSQNKIHFYTISNDIKSFQKLYTLTLKPEDISLNCFKINENLLATGDDKGSLKLFEIVFNNNAINSINEINSNENAHWRGINKIAFGIRNKIKFLITASGDGTCKIFDITNPNDKVPIKMISFFSFRQTLAEPANYFMRDLIYINEKNIAFTIQSPKEGKSFLTKWNVSNINFVNPIETLKISNVPCSSFDINENKNYLGITDREGRIFFVDSNNMKITGWKQIGEDMLKQSKFYKNYLVTGSIGYMLRINKLMTGFNSALFKYMFYLALFLGVCYYIYLKKNNLIKEEDY